MQKDTYFSLPFGLSGVFEVCSEAMYCIIIVPNAYSKGVQGGLGPAVRPGLARLGLRPGLRLG